MVYYIIRLDSLVRRYIICTILLKRKRKETLVLIHRFKYIEE